MNSATAEPRRIVIAIDGYSSSGKSTMARRLASAIGYRYIDSGAMYRAVTLHALRGGLIDTATGAIDIPALEAALPGLAIDFSVMPDGSQHTLLCGADVERDIRTMQVSRWVSPVAAIPAVRRALTAQQQRLGRSKGIVMDGRDIGTTVFPDAELKVFVDASPEVRAQRRWLELQAKGDTSATYDTVLQNVRERDRIDSTRAESPLRKAPDAVVVDNGHMTLEEQDALMLSLYHKAAGL